MSVATCVHITATHGVNDTRIVKEARSVLRDGLADRVVIVARGKEGLLEHEQLEDGISIRRISPKPNALPKPIGTALRMLSLHRQYVEAVAQEKASVVVSHSLAMLRPGVMAKKKLRIGLVYDCHELESETNGLKGALKVAFKILQRAYIGKADAVVVVGESIADWYANTYRFMPRPFVARNIPDLRWQQIERTRLLRDRFGIPDHHLVFLFQGFLTIGRRIEDAIEVFKKCRPDRHVVFMGYGEKAKLIEQAAAECDRIHLHEAVPPNEVLRYTSSADVGLCVLEYVCLSYTYSLPNKLFEYMACGLPVISGNGPETLAILNQHGCGWTVDDSVDGYLQVINSISAQEVREKAQKALDAAPMYSWANEERQFLAAYTQALTAQKR